MTKTPDTFEQLADEAYWQDATEYPAVSLLAQTVDIGDGLWPGTQNEVRDRYDALEVDSRRRGLELGEELGQPAPANSLLRVIVDERFRRKHPMPNWYNNCGDPSEFNDRVSDMARSRWYKGPNAQHAYELDGMHVGVSRSVMYAVATLSGRQLYGVVSSNINRDRGGVLQRLDNVVMPKALKVGVGHTTQSVMGERGIHIIRAEIISPTTPTERLKGDKTPTLEAMRNAFRLRRLHPHAPRV